jgi:two-component system chemotaxis response regulator CheY
MAEQEGCTRLFHYAPPKVSGEIPVASDFSQLKILIVDDHFLIRQFVRRTLIDAGLSRIDMANDGQEAIDALEKAAMLNDIYDVLFLDWNMPGLTGIDVLSFVRGKPIYQNSAVIMFTAESEKTNIMKAIKMGATSYILKPISPVDLNKKVREIVEWLDNRRSAKG